MSHLTPEFSTPTTQDALDLLANMRQADIDELAVIAPGVTPLACIISSIRTSDDSCAMRLDGKLMCIFGIRAQSLTERTATIWALGTRLMDTEKRIVAIWSRHLAAHLAATLPWAEKFQNATTRHNVHCVNWLLWMGAQFHEPIELDDGNAILPFTISKEAI
jgi:hypothetical protein